MLSRLTRASSKTPVRILLGGAAIGLTLVSAPMLTRAIAGAAASVVVEEPRLLPAAAVKSAPAAGLQTVVLAGGCFWGIQGVFQHVDGVTKAVSGYAGGSKANAVYEVVGSGKTGHAESVQVTFDPKKVSYEELLRIFFSVATDPTQLDQQFPDGGPQYRGVIFYNTPDQKRVAEAYIAQLNAAKVYKRPIVTKVVANPGFYAAEDYHQDYLTLHPSEPYIAIYDIPKVQALKKYFPTRFRDKPVLVAAK